MLLDQQIESSQNYPPISYNDNDIAVTRPRYELHKDKPRYVWFAGDLMNDKQKQAFKALSLWTGGTFFNHGEVGTMWKTNYILRRAAITPLLKRPERAHSDMRIQNPEDGTGVSSITEVNGVNANSLYYQLNPGDEISNVLTDDNRIIGVIEIESLRHLEWEEGEADRYQKHFFPRWDEMLTYSAPFPANLRELEEIVRNGIDRADEQGIRHAGEQMMDSAQSYRNWGNTYLETQIALVGQGANPSGFMHVFSALAKTVANQLERELKPEAEIRNSTIAQGKQNEVVNSRFEAMIENQNRLIENQTKMFEAALGRQPLPVIEEQILPPEMVAIAEELEAVDAPKCLAPKGNGEPCQMEVEAAGEKCRYHADKE